MEYLAYVHMLQATVYLQCCSYSIFARQYLR